MLLQSNCVVLQMKGVALIVINLYHKVMIWYYTNHDIVLHMNYCVSQTNNCALPVIRVCYKVIIVHYLFLY